jgi:hypothetical protein
VKTRFPILLALTLVGCESSRQSASLTPEQVENMATRLANEKADTMYHRQPFHDGQSPNFVAGHWVWRQLSPGDLEATVDLAADGSTNSVVLNQLVMRLFF